MLTILQEWVLETVAALVRDMRKENEPDWGTVCCRTAEERARHQRNFEQDWDSLEQRIAIGLVQARALECRQQATQVLIRFGNSGDHAVLAAINEIVNHYNARSRALEAIGLEMAKQWPPIEEAPQGGPALVQ